ncbi:DUF2690 domain-containing protein [Kitasatospora sp. NPDC056446]|uniref:DUF2690 domain-containing protein n=1 Tax=Kitasatospora sp. NPDC056446 TaxID=3345819 RepID=UPI00367F0593
MASAWKELPEQLSEPARLLVEELRAIKDTAGLSLSELAARTHYSRASWERWLNGKRVLTEQALEALIGTVDCDAAELRRRWRQAVEPVADRADRADDGETADGTAAEEPADPAAADDPTDEPARPAWWRRPAVLVSAAVLLALLLVPAGLRFSRHDGQASAADAPSPAVPSAKPAPSTPGSPACQALGCAHKDPKTTDCGKDARTLQTQVVGQVVVYLRYSRTCQAAWAAITEGQPKDYATITDGTGDSETALIHYGYDNYSAMLNAADPTTTFQVCGYQPAGHDCTTVVSDLASVVASTPIPIGPASPPPGTGAGAATATPTTAVPATPATAEPTDPATAEPTGAAAQSR